MANWVNGKFVLSGADVIFGGGAGRVGLGTEINAVAVENNTQGIYTLNKDNDAFPKGIEPMQFSGTWDLRTNVASESFLDWLINNVLVKKSPQYTEFYIVKDMYALSDSAGYTLKFAYVQSFDITAREGEAVSLTARGIFRELASGGSANRESEDDPIVPATFAHSTFELNGVETKNVIRSASISVDTGVEPVYSFGGRVFAGIRCGRKTIRASLTLVLDESEFELVFGSKLLSYATALNGYAIMNPTMLGGVSFTLGWGTGSKSVSFADAIVDKWSISARPNELIEVDMDLLIRSV